MNEPQTMEEKANILKEELLKKICQQNDIAEDSGLAGDIDYALTMMRNELLSEQSRLLKEVLGKKKQLYGSYDLEMFVSVENILSIAKEHDLTIE